MAFAGPLEDRIKIRELVETYNDAVFRRDADAWGNTWAEDSEWHIFGQIIKGRSDIVSMWKMAMQSFSYVCLLYTSPSPRDQRGSRMPSSA